MEAAWLAALIIVPVFFNVYSSRIFEPDKLTLLRTLALIILAAWVLKLLDQGGPRWERLQPGQNWIKTLLKIPLLGLVAALAVLYLLSTIFSVSPYTSFWGSYQRLQGTYTMLAYLVVFASLVGNLRRRVQLERLMTSAILASLPVCLYGILQRYQADPIPWGGDVIARVASNMGNSIFVAAYLIMVFPLTAMRVVDAFEALMSDRGRATPNFVRATGYVFIAALQVITLYFSGSRGPWLGWAASLVLLWLGLSLIWRARWMTISGATLALLAGAFLVLLNIPNGPLESLRTRPEFGRLGQLLDADSRTGRVRVLIWKGAAELVQPHQPLEYPDGSKDTFNFLRPLIGYGPESMYVAYNPFYQPELTQVEKRNASPDRSHNETWDSLVITGGLGLALYLAIFGSVIYYALKWLGLVRSSRQRNLYLALYLGGGALSAIGFVAILGIAYLGVALPFGMVMGVILYLMIASLSGRVEGQSSPDDKLRAYVLLALVAAIVAHFIEINFGIAIAATRLSFWTYAGLILLAGYLLPMQGEYRVTVDNNFAPARPEASSNDSSPAGTKNPAPGVSSGRKKRPASRTTERTASLRLDPWLRQAIIIGMVLSIVLICLGYDFVSNASRMKTAGALIWSSLTSLPGKNTTSYGLLAMALTTWLMGGLLLTSEASYRDGDLSAWPKMMAVSLGLSLVLTLVFWFWHAGGLASLNRVNATTIDDVMAQVARSEQILTLLYVFLILLILSLAVFLPDTWPAGSGRWGTASVGVAAVLFILVFAASAYTNLRVIQADIAFKTADLFARPGTWPVSIRIYDQARDLAPNEDYYYLFLGRSYLEYAKTLNDAGEREQLIQQAADDLKQAQKINPLNTDHTANLARLHSLWAAVSTDATLRDQRAQQADQYFSRSVVLSPKNARLWDEWAVHGLNVMDQPEQAKERLETSLKIDPYYDWTYGLLGDYYARNVAGAPDVTPEQRQAGLLQATDYYSQAMRLADPANASMLYGYIVAYGGLQAQMGNLQAAAESYQRALQVWPDNPDKWRVQVALAQLYVQLNNPAMALEYARAGLEGAPEDQKDIIRGLITQLGGQP